MKATKEIFDRVNNLYAEIANQDDNCNDLSAKYQEYNALVSKYDFQNVVFDGEGNKQGVKFCWGGVFVPAKYDLIEFFTSSGVPVVENYAIGLRNGKDYLINYKGEEILEADELLPNDKTITPVLFRKAGKWGIAACDGSVVLENTYDSIQFDSNGFVFLYRDEKEGFIACGHVVEPKFDKIEIDDSDNLVVYREGVKGYVDENDEFTSDVEEAYYNMNMFL